MLNSQQQQFFNRVITLDFTTLLLTGEAGTGKTYTLTSALEHLHRNGKRVLLCAPTHMARLTIKGKLSEDVRDEIATKTVASLLRQFPFDSGFGDLIFKNPEGMDMTDKWDVIAIDECSMISEKAYAALKLCKVPVIFTGDFAQLPVVMSKKSNMQDDENMEHIHLTKQMRQSGVVHKIAEENRDKIKFPVETVADDLSSLYVHANLNKLLCNYLGNLMSDFRGTMAPKYHRFITQRNATCAFVNEFIREQFINSTEPFVVGEHILLNYTTPVAPNGEVVEILSVKQHDMEDLFTVFPWRSYELEIKGSMGICHIKVIPPADREKVENRIEELKERIKQAIISSNVDAREEARSEIKFIRDTWIPVNYPYAITAHKSQGQTIENVYVNTLELSKAPHKRALTYVAFSRASHSLHTVAV